jgi:hypothetical protein
MAGDLWEKRPQWAEIAYEAIEVKHTKGVYIARAAEEPR